MKLISALTLLASEPDILSRYGNQWMAKIYDVVKPLKDTIVSDTDGAVDVIVQFNDDTRVTFSVDMVMSVSDCNKQLCKLLTTAWFQVMSEGKLDLSIDDVIAIYIDSLFPVTLATAGVQEFIGCLLDTLSYYQADILYKEVDISCASVSTKQVKIDLTDRHDLSILVEQYEKEKDFGQLSGVDDRVGQLLVKNKSKLYRIEKEILDAAREAFWIQGSQKRMKYVFFLVRDDGQKAGPYYASHKTLVLKVSRSGNIQLTIYNGRMAYAIDFNYILKEVTV